MPDFTDARIQVNLSSLERAKSGSITGEVFLRFDGQYFPERDWSDFPVVVLTWWLDALTPLLSDKAGLARCRFMDGALGFAVRRRAETWEVEASPIGRRPVDGSEFVDSVLNASQNTFAECRRRGWQSEDLKQLSVALKTVASYHAT